MVVGVGGPSCLVQRFLEGELVVVLGVLVELLVHGRDHAQVVEVVALGCSTDRQAGIGEGQPRGMPGARVSRRVQRPLCRCRPTTSPDWMTQRALSCASETRRFNGLLVVCERAVADRLTVWDGLEVVERVGLVRRPLAEGEVVDLVAANRGTGRQ